MTIIRALLLLLAALLGGCSGAGYYFHILGGQMELWRRAQPIEEVINDPGTEPAVRKKLAAVLRMREFASRELALPDNRSYRNYADLQRRYVIWNVFAAPELSTRLKEWCFLVSGCVAYRGYFTKDEAEKFAAGLREAGDEVFVGGVPAYSTLGWFDDPVLNTFMYYQETEIARLLFHELAHQVYYLRGDSVFNESFATAVEQEGMRRWLERNGTERERADFQDARKKKAEFVALVLNYRRQLDELYRSGESDEAKRVAKARIFDELRQEYQRLKASWGGYDGYDGWFGVNLNNATLASVAAYTQLVPAFQALLAAKQGDLPRFYHAVKEVGDLPQDERRARLSRLVSGSGQ